MRHKFESNERRNVALGRHVTDGAFVDHFLHLIEEESSARGSRESCGDELRPVSQNGVTVGTREETRSADVVQEDAPHRLTCH